MSPTPLTLAVMRYVTDKFGRAEWIQFGIETGTLDRIQSHSRLLRSLDFGDDDYPVAVAEVIDQVMVELTGDMGNGWSASGGFRLQDLADAIPDLFDYMRETHPNIAGRATRYLNERGVDWPPSPNFTTPSPPPEVPVNIFLVHGHDVAARHEVQLFVHSTTGIMPTVLQDEASGGQTVIEKFEAYSANSSIAIVLLTPDDTGSAVGGDPQPRARQNVVLELGYFLGKLGRSKVIPLNASVESPSDLAGLVYVAYRTDVDWKTSLRRELRAAGAPIVN